MASRGGAALILAIMAFVQMRMCTSEINRQSFPNGFVFGTASSAFQVRTPLIVSPSSEPFLFFVVFCVFSVYFYFFVVFCVFSVFIESTIQSTFYPI